MHPIIKVTLRRPDLLAAHASHHAALLREQAIRTLNGLKTRALAGAIAIVATLIALVFTGAALMLGFMHGFAWSLLLVPGCTWLIAGVGGAMAMRPGITDGVDEVKAQVDADLAALHLAKESHA